MADTAEVTYECLPDSEANEAAYGWRGGCTELQFERKVIVGPCCVYPDGDGVPDSYKESWAVNNNYPLLRCWQSYDTTSTDYYNGDVWSMHDCGVTFTDRCGAYNTVQYACDRYSGTENGAYGCCSDYSPCWSVEEVLACYANSPFACGTPYLACCWHWEGTCCRDTSNQTVTSYSFQILPVQSEECYTCGDTCRWQCGDYQTSCYEWMASCEEWGGCPSECPEYCGFEESSSSAT